ncbi:MAG: esterase-like activity of phytase family protein [Verrucomicrobia bacterium]|nr:esterase-like activity of phytase family protein [Verrucomicrobiota bacterium]
MNSLPIRTMVHGTPVGGISGIDYDAKADRWLAVSDDRSEHGPARCFTVRLDYDERALRVAEIVDVTVLRQADGSEYPGKPQFARERRGDVPDFEALRLDPRDGTLWYSSEGDRTLGLNSFVRAAARDGTFRREWPLPVSLTFDVAAQRGPRPNLTLEGMAFAPDGDSLWLALEAPLIEDGPVAAAGAGATTRFTRLARDGRRIAQVAYAMDAWQSVPPAGRPGDNGVSEILALPDGRLLVLERSGAQQADRSWRFSARIYLADVAAATDVGDVASLSGGKFVPAPKRLVFDFAAVGVPAVDNVEAMAWGRTLANGHATLVVASDDNFLPTQVTQFWVFEVLPPTAR